MSPWLVAIVTLTVPSSALTTENTDNKIKDKNVFVFFLFTFLVSHRTVL